MTDQHTDAPDPRIEELLERWTWDAGDLSAEELAELESSAYAREAMRDLRRVEERLGGAAGDEERNAIIADAIAATDDSDREFAARIAGPQPTATPTAPRFGWVRNVAAAAAVLLLVIWGVQQFGEDPDIPLGPGEFRAEWNPPTIRWTVDPPEFGKIAIEIRPAASGDTETFEIYDSDPEYGAGSFTVDHARSTDAFSFRIQFLDVNELVVKSTRTRQVRWD